MSIRAMIDAAGARADNVPAFAKEMLLALEARVAILELRAAAAPVAPKAAPVPAPAPAAK